MRMFTITTSIQPPTGGPGQRNSARKRNKSHPESKEKSKIFLLADDTIVYVGISGRNSVQCQTTTAKKI